MLKKMTKKEFADKIGFSNYWVTNLMARPEFQKHQRGKYILITSFLKSDIIDYLEKRVNSSGTRERDSIKYLKLISSNLSCLDK